MSNTWESGPSDGDYEQNERKSDLSTKDLQRVEDAELCRRSKRTGLVIHLGRTRVRGFKWDPPCILLFNFEKMISIF